MSNKAKKYLIIALVALAAIFGVYVLTSAGEKQSEQAPIPKQSGSEVRSQGQTETATQNGTISGSYTFPGSRIPSELVACAEELSSGREVLCSEQQITDNIRFFNGIGYELSLAPGEYYIYAKTSDNTKAYYNEYMSKITPSGEWPDYDTNKCGPEDVKLAVSITSGQEIVNVTLGDWYFETSCQISQ